MSQGEHEARDAAGGGRDSPLSPLESRLRSLRSGGRAGVVPFVTAGYPAREATVPLLAALERAGAVAVELGIPFSDPLADGPVIQRTSQRALENGVNLSGVLASVREFHRHSALPVVLMSYVNPVLAHGPERFAREANAAGVSGVILTDLPPEERPDIWSHLASEGVDPILLIAPTTDPDRLTGLARRSRGFVYCVSRTGVTGARRAFASELESVVARVRRVTTVPVAVGFGVDSGERACRVAAIADAVIVGAAVCERLERGSESGLETAIAAAEEFVRELVEAVAPVVKQPPVAGE